jgi:hypothetical protein
MSDTSGPSGLAPALLALSASLAAVMMPGATSRAELSEIDSFQLAVESQREAEALAFIRAHPTSHLIVDLIEMIPPEVAQQVCQDLAGSVSARVQSACRTRPRADTAAPIEPAAAATTRTVVPVEPATTSTPDTVAPIEPAVSTTNTVVPAEPVAISTTAAPMPIEPVATSTLVDNRVPKVQIRSIVDTSSKDVPALDPGGFVAVRAGGRGQGSAPYWLITPNPGGSEFSTDGSSR